MHLVGLGVADREHDDRDIRIASDRLAGRQSTDSRHVDVEQHQVGTELADFYERLLPGLRIVHFIPLSCQGGAHDPADTGLVVHDQNAARAHLRCSSFVTGSVSRNVVSLGRLSTVRSPLCACAIRCAMLRPRPEPGI